MTIYRTVPSTCAHPVLGDSSQAMVKMRSQGMSLNSSQAVLELIVLFVFNGPSARLVLLRVSNIVYLDIPSNGDMCE